MSQAVEEPIPRSLELESQKETATSDHTEVVDLTGDDGEDHEEEALEGENSQGTRYTMH